MYYSSREFRLAPIVVGVLLSFSSAKTGDRNSEEQLFSFHKQTKWLLANSLVTASLERTGIFCAVGNSYHYNTAWLCDWSNDFVGKEKISEDNIIFI